MPLTDRSFEEKRDFIRMQINSSVTITDKNNTYTGICKDLSGTGMRIETGDSFTVGNELTVSIQQKDEVRKPFNAIVEVTRIEEGDNDKQLIGLTIKEILP